MRKGLLCFTALLASCFSINAIAEGKVYKLKLAESWPTKFPLLDTGVQRFAKMAEQMSDGRLVIRVDSANKHKAPLGIFDLVKSGQYDMGHSASYYYKGKVPNTMFFTTMPFGMTAMEQHAWYSYGGGKELMAKVYEPHNLLTFPGGNTGVQMGGWFRNEINSVGDLQNLKMRIPGFAGEVLAKLGATPVNIPPAELYTALERNTIDALEWVGPSLDLRMGFHKIAPYYYTGWHEPGSENMFLMNKKKFESLPADLQAILETAMRATAFDIYVEATAMSTNNWATMLQEYPDIKVRTFPKEVLTALKKANDELLAEHAARDPLAKEIIESQQSFTEKARAYTLISDLGYLESTKDL
ncbi:ABC transporter substrate-binding protein [Agarivorans sp. B2Z047]|uniref:TRAP transporter substrate-binding protein n=1 Tax=Agarivorans sp. B2Z047 TaxID=2652721 RepID=UPI00128D03D5|nr:TRAP transporter substrate-binding protein [Agarivorans sp. B2Z047]MPW31559.1 ABC transporter substrate-binding protein [Agarivorans sp. B2Z047]UQN42602.1 TRAP transporter substrate-binding protein [Agarivorans sp. B2Z047]